MAATVVGRVGWGLGRDQEGYREYKLRSRVRVDDVNDGPLTVMGASGLPLVGAIWAFGNESDSFAWCRPDASITPVVMDEPHTLWDVEQKFSNKPFNTRGHDGCADQSIDDPLTQPMKLSGSFVKYTEQAFYDKDDNRIVNILNIPISGPEVEFDHNRPTVHIEQNVASLDLANICQMIDKLNDNPMWGLDARCVKLSNISWERQAYGTCGFYFIRKFDFDIRFDTFDRHIANMSPLVRKGQWNSSGVWVPDFLADATNPQNLIQYHDQTGAAVSVLIDENGDPAISPDMSPDTIVQYYKEADLLTLGIPSSIG